MLSRFRLQNRPPEVAPCNIQLTVVAGVLVSLQMAEKVGFACKMSHANVRLMVHARRAWWLRASGT